MVTEVFAWGYTAWRTQRPAGYEMAGYLDGREVIVVKGTADDAERLFRRAARRAWLRRKVRVAFGLPARTTPRVSSADTYADFSLLLLARVAAKELGRAVLRQLRR